MVTLPPSFNFPGAQQGIPQGIFQLVQSMSGMGGGMPNQLGGGLSQSIGQLMNPGVGGGINSGTLPTLPGMPVVPKAPIIEPRGPKPPIVDPTQTPQALDWKNMTGQEMWNLTEGPGAMTSGIPKRPKDFKPSAEQISGMHQAAQAHARNAPGRR